MSKKWLIWFMTGAICLTAVQNVAAAAMQAPVTEEEAKSPAENESEEEAKEPAAGVPAEEAKEPADGMLEKEAEDLTGSVPKEEAEDLTGSVPKEEAEEPADGMPEEEAEDLTGSLPEEEKENTVERVPETEAVAEGEPEEVSETEAEIATEGNEEDFLSHLYIADTDVLLTENPSLDVMEYISDNLDPLQVESTADYAKMQLGGIGEDEAVLLDNEIARRSDITPTAHRVDIQYTIADKKLLGESRTMDEIVADHWDAYVAAYEIYAQVYAVDDNEDCFVAFVNPNLMNGQGEALSIDITDGNGETPTVYNEHAAYDMETGIVYLPKSYFYEENGEEAAPGKEQLRIQALVAIDMELLKNPISVTIENETTDVECKEKQTIVGSSLGTQIVVPIATPDTAGKVREEGVFVYVNDSAMFHLFDQRSAFYDRTTGLLYMNLSPITLYSLRIVLENPEGSEEMEEPEELEESKESKALEEPKDSEEQEAFKEPEVMDESEESESKSGTLPSGSLPAATGTVTSWQNMNIADVGIFLLGSGVKAGDYVDLPNVPQQYCTDGTPYRNWTEEQKEDLMKYAKYAYYSKTDNLEARYVEMIDKYTYKGAAGGFSSLIGTGGVGDLNYATYNTLWNAQFYFTAKLPKMAFLSSSTDGKVYSFAKLSEDLTWLPMHCTHQANSLAQQPYTTKEYNNTLRVRVLDIDRSNKKVALGFMTPFITNTQGGAGIYVIRYKNLVPVRVAKRGLGTHSRLGGATYTFYSDAACTKYAKDITGKYTCTSTASGSYAQGQLWYEEGTTLYVKETRAPAGTLAHEGYYKLTVKYDAASGVQYITGSTAASSDANYVEDEQLVRIRLHKTDEAGQPLAGAVYRAYSDADCKIPIMTAGANSHGAEWISKAAEAKAASSEMLTLPKFGTGSRLYIREISSPPGYALDDGYYVLTISSGAKYRVMHYDKNHALLSETGELALTKATDGCYEGILTVEDAPERESLQTLPFVLTKKDMDLSAEGPSMEGSSMEGSSMEGSSMEGPSMEGAVFALEAIDCDKVWYFRTDEEGRICFADPRYRIEEQTFEVAINRTKDPFGLSGVTLVSDEPHGYAIPVETTSGGLLYQEGSAEDPEAVLVYQPGEYRIREILPPENYSLEGELVWTNAKEERLMAGSAAAGLSFMIKENPAHAERKEEPAYLLTGSGDDGGLPEEGVDLQGLQLVAYDRAWPAEICVEKKDGNGHALAGVTFLLTRSDTGEEIGSLTTDKEGRCSWQDLTPGEYRLTETSTREGYTLLWDSITISVPLRMTAEELVDKEADVTEARFDPHSGSYIFDKVTYVITNEAELTLPGTGGNPGSLYLIMTIAAGCILCGIFAGAKTLCRS